mmetsp:Transcript_436/g.774  ORF Transcript_436/g.774 Transcript_436/m.774 type:complete len:131 (+) Transcript_436:424-816(+)|eukprot:CAMPEP_0113906786 /NCGR_PEP_ID=MMETSP0780_2-20120614/25011_1 /TAXON_ID=652834 /ORGANISM="Palpitomonas bilix" /LENGTH=130 /DNA_ID=CAMNT_0000901565 /DNA_START=59 /DNA_END=451 /DNA_ORIENTATION=- /assembly_acc=CAM_ASM_000599
MSGDNGDLNASWVELNASVTNNSPRVESQGRSEEHASSSASLAPPSYGEQQLYPNISSAPYFESVIVEDPVPATEESLDERSIPTAAVASSYQSSHSGSPYRSGPARSPASNERQEMEEVPTTHSQSDAQ